MRHPQLCAETTKQIIRDRAHAPATPWRGNFLAVICKSSSWGELPVDDHRPAHGGGCWGGNHDRHDILALAAKGCGIVLSVRIWKKSSAFQPA